MENTQRVSDGTKDQPNCDFGKHIMPYCRDNGKRLFAYEFNGYWKDVGTLGSYWEANMELIDIIPEFNLYEEFWKIYTKSDIIASAVHFGGSVIERSIIGEGAEIYGEVHNSVIGADVTIEKGAVVRDSIIMKHVPIGEEARSTSPSSQRVLRLEKMLLQVSARKLRTYETGCLWIRPCYNRRKFCYSVRCEDWKKHSHFSGETTAEDYPDGELVSGGAIVKEGE